MSYLKKLIFALPFLLATAAFGLQAAIFFKDFLILFSFDMNLLFQLIFFAISIVATAYFFIVFANLAADWILVLPVALLSSISVFLLTIAPVSYFLAGGLFVAFCISFAFLFNKIKKDPISFHTSTHVIKPTGQLITLIILIASATLYFAVSTNREQVVQKLIDSVVNLSTDFVKNQQTPQSTDSNQLNNIPFIADEINSLKQNPELIKQAGFDPSVLDQVTKTNTTVIPQNLAAEAAKPLITNWITPFIQPYLFIIPFLIAFIFYLNFQLVASILLFISSPIIYLLFWILEKIGFITFQTETREVKKLVV